jgi:hypothetical protein
MKKFKILYTTIIILITGLAQQSCTDGFENMNRDWQNPTQATIPTMMNSVLGTFYLGYMEQNAIHNAYYYACTQQLANAAQRYSITQGESEIWSAYYSALRTIRALQTALENNATSVKVDNLSAMLKVCLAYKTLRTADYYGDMPFTMAGYGEKGGEYLRPKYDKHEDIYKTCLTMLKEASDGFVNGDASEMVCVGDAYNIFWQSSFSATQDYTMWRKLANSLRLRYAMQISDVDATTAQSIIAEILGNPTKYPLLDSESRDETAGLWPKKLSTTFSSRPWSFSAENLTCMGSVMWTAMTDLPVPSVGSQHSTGDGIKDPKFFDPRGYLFFETNMDSCWIPQKQFNANFVQAKGAYLNESYPKGRDHAQTLTEWKNKGNAYYSSVNYYLARDEESYPELMMTEAEVFFLKAEAYARGIGVSKSLANAKTNYEAGIRASMRTWFSFYTLINSSTYKWKFGVPPVLDSETQTLPTAVVNAYISHSGVAFSSNESDALKQIYKQLWIDSFRQPWVAFNLYRRVGSSMLPGESGLSTELSQFYRVPYPDTEITYNKANYDTALNGRANTPQSAKLFWQK